MLAQVPEAERADFAEKLSRVIDSGDVLLDTLVDGAERRRVALAAYVSSVGRLSEAWRLLYDEESDNERAYVQAAVQIQGGALLVAGGHAADTGDGSQLRSALEPLRLQQQDLKERKIRAFWYDADLLKPPPPSATAEGALTCFKTRASRTLDNMIIEARDVMVVGIEKIRKTFHSFSGDLVQLAEQFVSAEVMPVIVEGVKRIIAGLKMLADLFKSGELQKGLETVKDVLDADEKLSPEEIIPRVLSVAFGCSSTKRDIEGLELGYLTQKELESAEARMAELSVEYVQLLKQARWVLTGVSLAGGFLLLTGVAAHYSAVGVPVAYAIVTLATLIIGMEFAEHRMRALLEPLKASGVVPAP